MSDILSDPIKTDAYTNDDRLDARITSRQFKDSLLRALFKDAKKLIELYNAISGEEYPEEIGAKLCPQNPLMAMFNDIAFFVGSKLIVMCEHQSTINPNMPLRFLIYLSDVLRTHTINKDNLYRRSLVTIPTPEFYVLYNGKENLTAQKILLSDAFLEKDREFALELSAKVVNIKYDSGSDAIRRSATLRGYSYLIAEVEKNIASGMTRDKAIVKAINACIEKGILTSFLKENFMEAANMLTFEYDRESELRAMRLDGIEEGMEKGMEKGFQKGMQDIIYRMLNKGKSVDEVSELVGISIADI